MKKDKKFDKWFKSQFKYLPITQTERMKLIKRGHTLSCKQEVIQQALNNDDYICGLYQASLATREFFTKKKI